MSEQTAEKDQITTARLADTLRWVAEARQQASDLAWDAPLNPGIESLEEPAAAAEEALMALLQAAQTLVTPPATTAGGRDE